MNLTLFIWLSLMQMIYSEQSYAVVDTAQVKCFDNNDAISCPSVTTDDFYGQDANSVRFPPSYANNGDGTISDLVTGLMWQKDPGAKMSYSYATAGATSFNLAGYTDWRLPTIKELYSLILFTGTDLNPMLTTPGDAKMFIDTDYFDASYGDTSVGERLIDSQMATSTIYRGTTMGGNPTMFGVNFADGRIKGYPYETKTFFVFYVRGAETYGLNDFVDRADGTIYDASTGLVWQQTDSGVGMNWQDALSFVQVKNNENYLGFNDWRLPHAKELQSIVDYSRSVQVDGSAAIDPIFEISSIVAENGQLDYPFFWSSTTHEVSDGPVCGASAVYISFGQALGYFQNIWQDVHGCGAQRSDPKSGDPNDYPFGHGPQGDAIRINNYVRLVRTAGEIISDPCDSIECNNGRCSEGACVCDPGWKTENCNEWHCDTIDCNNGFCSGPLQCTCETKWSGDFCTVYTPSCDPDCGENGICLGDGVVADYCECDDGWVDDGIGGKCNHPYCGEFGCNEGICSSPYQCDCGEHWADGVGEENKCTVPQCVPVTDCGTRGDCIAQTTVPHLCQCHVGWETLSTACDYGNCLDSNGESTCQTTEDCDTTTSTCVEGEESCGDGVCVDESTIECRVETNGDETCVCKDGWTGADCSEVVSTVQTITCNRPGGPILCVAENTRRCFRGICLCKPGFGGLLCENYFFPRPPPRQ